MDEPVKTGHAYPAGGPVFYGTESEAVYRERNARLVEALRSGNFTQTRGMLEAVTWNGYRNEVVGNCCLGVACRVAGVMAENFSIVTGIAGSQVTFGTASWAGTERVFSELVSGYPPEMVRQWFGWNSNDPQLRVNSYTYSASHLNDSMGADFDTIADAFERTFVTFTRKSVDDLTDDTYQRDAEGHAETTVTDLPE